MSQASDAIAYATAQIGKPYVWAASGPNSFDCSGLTMAAYLHAQPPVILPHWTGAQILSGVEVTQSQLQPGDLVFPDSGHVVLYIGDNQIIEAPHQGANVRQGPMYGFWRARRVTTDGQHSDTLTPAGSLSDFNPLNPLAPAEAVASGVGTLVKLAVAATSPAAWKRLGAEFIAFGLIVLGAVILFRRPIVSGMSGVANVLASAASSAGTRNVDKSVNTVTNTVLPPSPPAPTPAPGPSPSPGPGPAGPAKRMPPRKRTGARKRPAGAKKSQYKVVPSAIDTKTPKPSITP